MFQQVEKVSESPKHEESENIPGTIPHFPLFPSVICVKKCFRTLINSYCNLSTLSKRLARSTSK